MNEEEGMRKVAKVTISLPTDLLAVIDRTCLARGESRSEYIRSALEKVRREERERAQVEQYLRGYREQPQTEDELGWTDQVALDALAELPWEEDDETGRSVVGQAAATVAPAPGPAGGPR